MQTTITVNGKPVEVKLSRAADAALAQRNTPLLAEMELYFSCLIRKQVRFRDHVESASAAPVPVTDRLAVYFRPVMTQTCNVNDMHGEAPPVSDFEIKNPAAFVPHWLRIDYRGGEWSGEFGYCS